MACSDSSADANNALLHAGDGDTPILTVSFGAYMN